MNNGNLRTLSPSEARENGRLGGIASGEARREKKKLKEAIETALEATYTDMLTNSTKTNLEWIVAALIDEARKGNVSAFKELRNTVDGLPIQRIEQTEIDAEVYERVRLALEG